MSSLTESFLIYDGNDTEPKRPKKPKKPNNEPKKKEWYDVYLCIEKNGNSEYINGLNCYTFTNFIRANDFYYKNHADEKNRHIIIPVCKWIPFIFQKYYLNYTLKKLYWKNDITIFRNEKYS